MIELHVVVVDGGVVIIGVGDVDVRLVLVLVLLN
jgi:hypothetical protein